MEFSEPGVQTLSKDHLTVNQSVLLNSSLLILLSSFHWNLRKRFRGCISCVWPLMYPECVKWPTFVACFYAFWIWKCLLRYLEEFWSSVFTALRWRSGEAPEIAASFTIVDDWFWANFDFWLYPFLTFVFEQMLFNDHVSDLCCNESKK